MSWAKPILMELGALLGMVSKEELVTYKKSEEQRLKKLADQEAEQKYINSLDEKSAKEYIENYGKKSLPDIPKVNETTGVKTVHNNPTYHITVNNPADGFDIEKEMKKVEQKNKNKQLEDLD